MQLALTVVLTLLAMLFYSGATAASVFAGGLIGVVAGFYQALRMLSVDAGEHPESFMSGVWVSELAKIVLTVALFIIAIRLFRVQMAPTIIGYAGTYIVYWVALGTSYPWFETPLNDEERERTE